MTDSIIIWDGVADVGGGETAVEWAGNDWDGSAVVAG
jgi:hypothetical protein